MNDKLLLNYTEAGELLGVNRRTVEQWVKAGALRTVSPNGRPFIPRAAILKFAEAAA